MLIRLSDIPHTYVSIQIYINIHETILIYFPDTIDYLNGLHSHGGSTEHDVKRYLAKAKKILREIERRNFDNEKFDADSELKTAKIGE